MAKAPRLGAVKRRLGADIGAVAARWFYLRSLGGLLERVGRDRRWRCWLALTPDRFAAQAGPWPAGIPRLAQGSGDLGRRMARPLRLLPPGPVAIVGSDIPGLEARHVARAFAALKGHDLVFGPAEDGGFWLVGARRRPPPPDLFRGVRWSTPHALADTLANVASGVSVALLETLGDVDTGADLARWRRRAGASGLKRNLGRRR